MRVPMSYTRGSTTRAQCYCGWIGRCRDDRVLTDRLRSKKKKIFKIKHLRLRPTLVSALGMKAGLSYPNRYRPMSLDHLVMSFTWCNCRYWLCDMYAGQIMHYLLFANRVGNEAIVWISRKCSNYIYIIYFIIYMRH